MTKFHLVKIAARQLAATWFFYFRYWPSARGFKKGLPLFEQGKKIAVFCPGQSIIESIPENKHRTFDYTISVNSFLFHEITTDVYFLELSRDFRNSQQYIERLEEVQPRNVFVPSHSLRLGSIYTDLLQKISDCVQIYNVCPAGIRFEEELEESYKCFRRLTRLGLFPRYTMFSPGASVSRILSFLQEKNPEQVMLFGVDGSTRYFFDNLPDKKFSFDTRQQGEVHDTADAAKKKITVDGFVAFLNRRRGDMKEWIVKV